MDRGAWQALVHGVTRIGHDLAIKPPPHIFLYGASLVAQMVKNPPAMWETWVHSLGWEDPLEWAWQPTPVFFLENPTDRGVWWATVHGVTRSRT